MNYLSVRMAEQLDQLFAKRVVAHKRHFGAVVLHDKIPQGARGVTGAEYIILRNQSNKTRQKPHVAALLADDGAAAEVANGSRRGA